MQEESERVVEPTSRRLQRARTEGVVPRSPFLAGGVLLLTIFGLLWSLSGFEFFIKMLTTLLSSLSHSDLSEHVIQILTSLIWPLCSLLIGIWILSIGVHMMQVGWIWVRQEGDAKLRHTYSSDTNIFLKLLQFGITISFGIVCMLWKIEIAYWLTAPFLQQVELLLKRCFYGSCGLLGAYIFLGVIDFILQRKNYFHKMCMTRQEKKEELEGREKGVRSSHASYRSSF